MADLAHVLAEKFKGQVYSEFQLVEFLEDKGYGNIKVAEIPETVSFKRMIRYIMSKEGVYYTLFVSLGKEDICNQFYFRDGYVYSLNEKKEEDIIPKDNSTFVLFISIVGAVSALLIVFSLMFGGSEDEYEYDYDYDDEPTYRYDPDDKDYDGDVDYDDVEKYLEDSLEEDKNDGDDW